MRCLNYILISPGFPRSQASFARSLKEEGITVLGIGTSYAEDLDDGLKDALTEFYHVSDLLNNEEVLKAVGYFTYRYGKIDRIESHNEYWLVQDAWLRTEFNVFGLKDQDMEKVKYKSKMKEVFRSCGIPVARGAVVRNLDEAKFLIREFGYPVVVKPDMGVGAQNTSLIQDEDQLQHFFETKEKTDYILEEYINGTVVSFDGLTDREGRVVFCSNFIFNAGVMDIVNKDLDMFYYTERHPQEDLVRMGLKAVKAFNLKERFFHMEFFRKMDGGLVALEVNVRPPGGYSIDMWNYSYDVDMYHLYARLVARNEFDASIERKYYCAHVGRKYGREFRHDLDEVVERCGPEFLKHEELPGIFAKALGDHAFIFRAEELDDVMEKAKFILETV